MRWEGHGVMFVFLGLSHVFFLSFCAVTGLEDSILLTSTKRGMNWRKLWENSPWKRSSVIGKSSRKRKKNRGSWRQRRRSPRKTSRRKRRNEILAESHYPVLTLFAKYNRYELPPFYLSWTFCCAIEYWALMWTKSRNLFEKTTLALLSCSVLETRVLRNVNVLRL